MKPLGPELCEPRILAQAPDHPADFCCVLVEPSPLRASAGDNRHLKIDHGQILTQGVTAGIDLAIHRPPAISDALARAPMMTRLLAFGIVARRRGGAAIGHFI
jgi:hypothetical protein